MQLKPGHQTRWLTWLMVLAVVIGTILPLGTAGTAIADDASTPITDDPTALPTTEPTTEPATEPTAEISEPTAAPTDAAVPSPTTEPAVVAADVVPVPTIWILPAVGEIATDLASPYVVPDGYLAYAHVPPGTLVGYFENGTCDGDPDGGWNSGTSPAFGTRAPLAFQAIHDGVRSDCILVNWEGYVSPVVPVPEIWIQPSDGSGPDTVLASPYIVPDGYLAYGHTPSGTQVGYFENGTCVGEPDVGWNSGTPHFGVRPPLGFQALRDGVRSACIVVTWEGYVAPVVPVPEIWIVGNGSNTELESPYVVPDGYKAYAAAPDGTYIGYFENRTCDGEPDLGWDTVTSTFGARPPLAFQAIQDGVRSACIVVTWEGFVVPVPEIYIYPYNGDNDDATALESPYLVPYGYYAFGHVPEGTQIYYFEDTTCAGEPAGSGSPWYTPPFGVRAPLAFQAVQNGVKSACIVVTWEAEPTATPTATPTNTPTATPTNTPTATPTNTPTNTPTATPTNTPTTVPTNTPTVDPPTATAAPTSAPAPPVRSLPNTGAGQQATSPALFLLLAASATLLFLVGLAGWRRRTS